MSSGLIRGNAVAIPLRDESVDLIVTSPPYFALRSYRDDGEHYDGQIGSEPTPQAFLEALWSVMHECWRVLKPEGVCFVNLGDKRSGSGGHNNSNLGASSILSDKAKEYHAGHGERRDRATRRNAPDRYNQAAFGRAKSKMLLPHRFAIGCEDGLADPEGVGWIVRQDIVWSKPNGLPESVTDRPRDSHEFWFMLTKEGRYYSAVDEVRESYAPGTAERYAQGYNPIKAAGVGIASQGPARGIAGGDGGPSATNPLGKLPGSVWTVPSEPLRVPDWARERLDLPDHFAAFPQEWPRRLILGWSPPGVCVECGLPWEHDGTDTTAVRGVRTPDNGRSPDESRHEAASVATEPLLLQGLFQPDNRTGASPRADTDDEGVHRAAPTGPPNGEQARLRDGAPQGNGGSSGQAAAPLGSGASPQWGEGRQPDRESGTDGEAGPRPASEHSDTSTGVHVSALRPRRMACRCGSTESKPSVILDMFCGTGTVPMVARALGRYGVGIDLSADYLRLARWRTFESGHAAKAVARTNREAQGTML